MSDKKQLPTWDLEAIYPTTKAWEEDFAKLKGLAEACLAFKGKLAKSAKTLRDCYEAMDAYGRLCEKVYVYASMKSDENTLDSENRGRVGRIESLFAELAPCFAWFDPELLAIPSKTMDAYLKSDTLSFYKRSIQEALRGREHTLSEPEERLLGMYSEVASRHVFRSARRAGKHVFHLERRRSDVRQAEEWRRRNDGTDARDVSSVHGGRKPRRPQGRISQAIYHI